MSYDWSYGGGLLVGFAVAGSMAADWMSDASEMYKSIQVDVSCPYQDGVLTAKTNFHDLKENDSFAFDYKGNKVLVDWKNASKGCSLMPVQQDNVAGPQQNAAPLRAATP